MATYAIECRMQPLSQTSEKVFYLLYIEGKIEVDPYTQVKCEAWGMQKEEGLWQRLSY